MTDRKLRLLSISPELVLSVLTNRASAQLMLPPDVIVHSVSGNWLTQTVDLLLFSESFDPVPINQTIPHLSDAQMKTVKMRSRKVVARVDPKEAHGRRAPNQTR